MSSEQQSRPAMTEKAPDMKDIIARAQNHVEKNKFKVDRSKPVTKRKNRCVDGGYTPDQIKGSFARPGADGGYVEAALKVAKDLGIELSGARALQMVSSAIQSFGREFDNHTDVHSVHDNHELHGGPTKIGCGHEQGAVVFADKYGVEATAMQEVIDVLNSDHTPTPVETTVLDREHKEQAVLVVCGDEYSVMPWDAQKENMYFIYDADVDKTVMEAVWKHMVSQQDSPFAKVPFEVFEAAANLQTGVTVDRLATSKGSPTLYVRFDKEGNPTVSEK